MVRNAVFWHEYLKITAIPVKTYGNAKNSIKTVHSGKKK